jgi:hypothetical protein
VFRVPRCWAHGEVLGAGYETVSTDEYTTLRSSVTDTFLGFGTEDYISVILLGTEEYKKTKEGTLFSCSVRCPFTKKLLDANWCVGANMTQTRERETKHLKRALRVPFAMEIIIAICWCIWKERNG